MQNMNAYRQQKWEKFEVRRAYTGTWLVEMLDAPCQHPSCCLLSILWCASLETAVGCPLSLAARVYRRLFRVRDSETRFSGFLLSLQD